MTTDAAQALASHLFVSLYDFYSYEVVYVKSTWWRIFIIQVMYVKQNKWLVLLSFLLYFHFCLNTGKNGTHTANRTYGIFLRPKTYFKHLFVLTFSLCISHTILLNNIEWLNDLAFLNESGWWRCSPAWFMNESVGFKNLKFFFSKCYLFETLIS